MFIESDEFGLTFIHAGNLAMIAHSSTGLQLGRHRVAATDTDGTTGTAAAAAEMTAGCVCNRAIETPSPGKQRLDDE